MCLFTIIKITFFFKKQIIKNNFVENLLQKNFLFELVLIFISTHFFKINNL